GIASFLPRSVRCRRRPRELATARFRQRARRGRATLRRMLLLALLAAAAAPCTPAQRHLLDFWEGSWDVSDPQTGKLAGDNVIAPILSGCGLRESWTDAQ